MSKATNISFSIIVPVYNRPDEIKELLDSLTKQTFTDFEVIIVEDGSSVLCEKVSRDFMEQLDLKYFYKENSGPGTTRNYGMKRATGNYFIILDSDVIVPKDYMKIVAQRLTRQYVDAYGGPDAAMENFTPVQKAINYAMTSIFTTGGIRGASEKMEKFHPRSFNMGLSKEVFSKTGGFSKLRFGEDIDLSIRIMQSGFKTTLFPDAFVYHKRRNTFQSFFKQVYNSGIARINLFKRYPKSLKPAHFFPAVFSILLILSLILNLKGFSFLFLLFVLYASTIFIDALIKYKSLKTASLSVFASFLMLFGYGLGFINSFIKRVLLNKKEFTAFDESFYE